MSHLTAEALDDQFNPRGDGEHPVHTRDEWRGEVMQENTVAGYWQWLADTLNDEAGPDPKKANALVHLRNAVARKLTYWDAMNALETAFGFPDGEIPDELSDVLHNTVEILASGGGDDGSSIEMYHVDTLATDLKVTW